jgi:hypothetical protein
MTQSVSRSLIEELDVTLYRPAGMDALNRTAISELRYACRGRPGGSANSLNHPQWRRRPRFHRWRGYL